MKPRKIEPNELSNETRYSMIIRIITGIVMAIICVPCIVLGSWYFFFLILVVTILSAYELAHITDLKGTLKVILSIITIIMTVCIVFYVFYKNHIRGRVFSETDSLFQHQEFLSESFKKIDISVMLVTLMAAILFIISFVSKDFNVKYVFYFVTMILVVAIGVQSFMFLRYSPKYFFEYFQKQGMYQDMQFDKAFDYGQSMFLFLYVFIGVITNDIGAYFIGTIFGKHKINEKISPKKTWEGFLGGVVISLICSTAFAVISTYCGKPLIPFFDFVSGPFGYSAFALVIISLFLPILADVGDFIFSAVKRYWGVKDFSKILPGHGGLLDRIDSMIFSAALVSCLIIFVEFVFYPNLLI